jgi:sugar phosphate isomerase/epimerase
LTVSLAGLERDPVAPWAGGPRAAIEWAAAVGARAVQLDATAAGVRARDLDRSGRRDLASLLRRLQLTFSGLDLWIPPEHFLDPGRADRALAAAQGAVELAADLARLIDGSPPPQVSLILPDSPPAGLSEAITAAAVSRGARIADYAIREIASGQPASAAPGLVPGMPGPTVAAHPAQVSADSPIGPGLDPAALILAGRDPAAAAARAGAALVSARLSDASMTGRTVPGQGRLDMAAYLASLSVAGYARPLVLDLRGLPNQDAAARTVVQSWP